MTIAKFVIFVAVIANSSAHIASPSMDASERRAVEALWSYHLCVASSAADNNERIDLRRFAESVEVLERITGVLSNTGTWAGRVPTPDLRRTVRQWEYWFRKNGAKLHVRDFTSCMGTKEAEHKRD